MKSRLRGATLLIVLLGLGAIPAVARAAVPNPPANQKATDPSVCAAQPTSTACENRWIYNLDKARTAAGLGPYKLPAGFTTMTPAKQVLILANLDRLAYGLPAVVGLDPSLASSMDRAVSAGADPLPPAGYPGSGAFGSSWGGGYPNIVHLYWAWLYADGYGSENLDCSSPAAAGCWSHRQSFFVDAGPGDVAVMGVGAGRDSRNKSSFAMLLIGRRSTAPPPAYTYTWAQAVAEGAGTFDYDPGRNPRLTINATGPGSVTGSVSCRRACNTYRTPGTRLTLRAKSYTHARFLGWTGACTGKGACRLTLDGDTVVTARFACRAPWSGPSCRSRRA